MASLVNSVTVQSPKCITGASSAITTSTRSATLNVLVAEVMKRGQVYSCLLTALCVFSVIPVFPLALLGIYKLTDPGMWVRFGIPRNEQLCDDERVPVVVMMAAVVTFFIALGIYRFTEMHVTIVECGSTQSKSVACR